MKEMRSLLFCLFLMAGITMAGCGGPDIPTDPNRGNLPFGLVIPNVRAPADYYAVSGVTTRMVATKIGDSIVESPQTLFYAQFTSSPIVPVLKSVTLNQTPLDRHLNTDTLRLGRSTGPSINSDNTWELIDSAGTKATFLMPKIDVIDTVSPFDNRSTVRGDTDLVVRWRRPTLATNALHILWKTPNGTYEKIVNDPAGFHMIPKAEMLKLRGRGQVVLTRYFNVPQKFQGRNVLVTRLAQRSFTMEVL